ncbi:hypothetical protein NL460_28910, partial [Klebsiella pneumoniae]|nr:hypothetical protein [Klebsiella pneumoniae]
TALVSTWDRTDPFAGAAGNPPPGTQTRPPQTRKGPPVGTLMVTLAGRTKECRHEIKLIPGWHYNPDGHVWSIPSLEKWRRLPDGV